MAYSWKTKEHINKVLNNQTPNNHKENKYKLNSQSKSKQTNLGTIK